ncbi:hypothetical protein [Methyloglobulus sp.]|uniref:hypothetical protein n=1 Tax=Methyloglobulus sp. TaxID=2518622 RepID=UPI0039899940
MKNASVILIGRAIAYGVLGGSLFLHLEVGYSKNTVTQGESHFVLKTAKERLKNKAADNQRVNNCKVHQEQRGSQIRPNECKAAVTINQRLSK